MVTFVTLKGPDEEPERAELKKTTTSISWKLQDLERQISLGHEEEVACSLKLSGLRSIVDDWPVQKEVSHQLQHRSYILWKMILDLSFLFFCVKFTISKWVSIKVFVFERTNQRFLLYFILF